MLVTVAGDANAGTKIIQTMLLSLFTELLFENGVDCEQETVTGQILGH